MTSTTKGQIALTCVIILTVVIFFLSVRKNTPPSFEEIFKENSNTTQESSTTKTPTITIADPQKGLNNAKVTIVEFADYQCSHCAETNQTLKDILNKYPQEVRLVWKDFPFLQPIEVTWQAHMAARCAGKQNKFWEFHDLLFENQNNLGTKQFSEMAKLLNLNISSFETCLNNEETRPLVEKSFKEGQDIGVDGTPTFYINGGKINNLSIEVVEGLINK
ncbi:MAG: thioredoxin domain-containing protein [Candidatus Magasanikbacteria bacterium]|nr:thioredoxin domain-containing protein [Candidatus Magasanikbacteria bacterium]